MEKDKILVDVDAGHGGVDCGALKFLNERDEVLKQANAVKAFLEACGIACIMSRKSNKENPTLNARTAEANKNRVDAYVSLHLNAGKGDGYEVYHSIFGGRGKLLASAIGERLYEIGQNPHSGSGKKADALKSKKNANGKDYFAVIRDTIAPAVIVESCYVDNREDALGWCAEQYGYAVAKGICDFFGIKKRVYKSLANLNIHSSASVNGVIIGKLPKDALVCGTPDGTWLKIKYGNVSGYVRLKTSVREYAKEI